MKYFFIIGFFIVGIRNTVSVFSDDIEIMGLWRFGMFMMVISLGYKTFILDDKKALVKEKDSTPELSEHPNP